VNELAERHPIVRKFASLRSQSTIGQERIQSLAPHGSIWSIHSSRYRGATWHDEPNRVVWLLAHGIHRAGDRSDAYNYFVTLAEAQRLFPDDDDYHALARYRTAQELPIFLLQAQSLLEIARTEPGFEKTTLLSEGTILTIWVDAVDVDDVGGLEDVYISVTPGSMNKTWFPALLAALLEPLVPPDVEPKFDMWEDIQDFPSGLGHPHRITDANEIAFLYSRAY